MIEIVKKTIKYNTLLTYKKEKNWIICFYNKGKVIEYFDIDHYPCYVVHKLFSPYSSKVPKPMYVLEHINSAFGVCWSKQWLISFPIAMILSLSSITCIIENDLYTLNKEDYILFREDYWDIISDYDSFRYWVLFSYIPLGFFKFERELNPLYVSNRFNNYALYINEQNNYWIT